MRIDRLELENFRNYGRQAADFDSRCNVIFGENAQGKTNLLESLVYLSCGRSPRARTDREMIGFEAPAARMAARVFAREREFRVEVELYRDRRRRMSVNQVPAKNSAALSDVYQTVFFCPEDLFLIREGAAARRKFMDTALCQLRPRYAQALAEYSRLYGHKTRILRDWPENPSMLDTLDDFNLRMAQTGAIVVHYRAHFIKRLRERAPAIHRDFSGGREGLELRYETVSTVDDPQAQPRELLPLLLEHQEKHRKAEIDARQCLSGPHKDDLIVGIGGQNAKIYASQGQTRTAALSLKLAQREIFQEETGEWPVLLLDDVLSELDPRRQAFVLNRIRGGQVFITCCEEEKLEGLEGGRAFHIQNGRMI